MLRVIFLCFFGPVAAAAVLLGGVLASADEGADIKAVIAKQADAWNRGDIDAFMEHYWKSDELTFSSGGKITRGWKATKDRYKDRYPTRDEMGQVQFTQLELTRLGGEAAMVLGRWKLNRNASPIEGNFTLVFRRIDSKWMIIHDHTSKSEAP
jgi:L-asparaginase / beta-aspartyl-peptidase